MKYLLPCLLSLTLAACGVGPDDTTAPTVTQTSPSNNAKKIPLNQPFVVQFSEDVRKEDLTAENVKLTVRKEDGLFVGLGRNFMPPTAVSAKFSYNAKTHTLTITPQTALGLNEHYELVISNVRDSAGNPLPQVYRTQFFTAMHSTVLSSEEKSCIFDGGFLSTAEKCQLPEATQKSPYDPINNGVYSQANDLSYGLILEHTQPNFSGDNNSPTYKTITEYNPDGLTSKTIHYHDGKLYDTITYTYTRNSAGLITRITRTHQRPPASELATSRETTEEDTTEIIYQNGKITQAKQIHKEKIVDNSPYNPQVWEGLSTYTLTPNKSEQSHSSWITSYATGKPVLAQQTINTHKSETQIIGDTYMGTSINSKF